MEWLAEGNPCPCSAGQGGGNGGGGGGSGEPAEGGARCGVERWPVKTLSDRRARQVNFHPRRTNVDALRSKPTPGVGFSTPRITGVETTTYKLRAQLIEYAREDDHDIHLVIAAPSNPEKTMIVEFPDPGLLPAPASREIGRPWAEPAKRLFPPAELPRPPSMTSTGPRLFAASLLRCQARPEWGRPKRHRATSRARVLGQLPSPMSVVPALRTRDSMAIAPARTAHRGDEGSS